MRVVVVRRVVDRCEPGRLGVRDGSERSGLSGVDLLCLALDGPNLESSIGRLEKNFVSVETKEGLGRILTSNVGVCGRKPKDERLCQSTDPAETGRPGSSTRGWQPRTEQDSRSSRATDANTVSKHTAMIRY